MKKLSTVLVALVFVSVTTGICLAQVTPVVPAPVKAAEPVKAVEPVKEVAKKKEMGVAKEHKSKRKSSHKINK